VCSGVWSGASCDGMCTTLTIPLKTVKQEPPIFLEKEKMENKQEEERGIPQAKPGSPTGRTIIS
jgi:hypothetical protein